MNKIRIITVPQIALKHSKSMKHKMWSLEKPSISIPRTQTTWKLMGTERESNQELMLILHGAKNILRISVSVKNTWLVGFDF